VTGRSPSGECPADARHCVTCGDEGIPMRVVSACDATAVCADDDRRLHEVAIDLVAPVHSGDTLVVHAGFAIGQLEGAA
jgi:hydrogenase maturation factor